MATLTVLFSVNFKTAAFKKPFRVSVLWPAFLFISSFNVFMSFWIRIQYSPYNFPIDFTRFAYACYVSRWSKAFDFRTDDFPPFTGVRFVVYVNRFFVNINCIIVQTFMLNLSFISNHDIL